MAKLPSEPPSPSQPQPEPAAQTQPLLNHSLRSHSASDQPLIDPGLDNPPLYSDDPSAEPFSAASSDTPSRHSAPVTPSQPSKPSLKPPDFSAIDFGPDEPFGEGRPPEFSVYRASYITNSIGNITSHDAHLNSDGEALCRFILLQISAPPGLFVKLSGSHEDVRIETITEVVNGRTEYRTREQRNTVTDFSFTMPIPSEQALEHGIRRLYLVDDGAIVGRGGHWREKGRWTNGKDLRLLEEHPRLDDLPGRGRASVKWKERRRADEIAQQIKNRGHPPFIPSWIFPSDTFSVEPARPPDEFLVSDWQRRRAKAFSSLVHQGYYHHQQPSPREILHVERELREWCDDYCNNSSRLKEFRVEKSVFGWDLALLEQELLDLLHATPRLQSTSFSVDFYTTSSQIIVRPVDWLSKLFSLSGFYKFLLTITLIYPILWLLRYLLLGVEYDVVRVAYPLVYWEAADEMDRPVGPSRNERVLKGQTERDWLLANRSEISRACQDHEIGHL